MMIQRTMITITTLSIYAAYTDLNQKVIIQGTMLVNKVKKISIHRSILLTFLSLLTAQTALAMQKAPSPKIELVIKTAASIEEQRLNPPPDQLSLWVRRTGRRMILQRPAVKMPDEALQEILQEIEEALLNSTQSEPPSPDDSCVIL